MLGSGVPNVCGGGAEGRWEEEGEGTVGDRIQGGRGRTLLLPEGAPPLLCLNKTRKFMCLYSLRSSVLNVDMEVTLTLLILTWKLYSLLAEPGSSRAGPHLFCLNRLSR